MKKLFKILLITIPIFIFGCSKESGDGGKIVLSYGIWDMNQEPVIKELIKKFEKDNPNIEVRVNLTPWKQYWTKLEASASGGVAPDIFWMGMERGIIYSKAGMAAPLDKYIKRDKIDLNNYEQSMLGAYEVDGKIYAMPRDIDSIALWFNKKIFDEAGVSYPTNSWTWDDMCKAALKIRKKVKGVIPLAMNVSGQDGYYNMIYQSGGYVISDDMKKSGYDNPETIKGLSLIVKCINNGVMASKTQIADLQAPELFQSNKIAMFYAGSWMAGAFANNEIIKDNVGVVVMPLIKKRATIAHSIGLMMSTNSKHPEAAWEFIKFLTSSYAQEYLAEKQVVIPALKSAQKYWAESFNSTIKFFEFF
jgi:multiple sugar transport system substrate-binding protein